MIFLGLKTITPKFEYVAIITKKPKDIVESKNFYGEKLIFIPYPL